MSADPADIFAERAVPIRAKLREWEGQYYVGHLTCSEIVIAITLGYQPHKRSQQHVDDALKRVALYGKGDVMPSQHDWKWYVYLALPYNRKAEEAFHGHAA